jgi:tRNA pseudouridine55 synthase
MEKDKSTNFLQDGVVLIDKPNGVSSHWVVNWARKHSGIKKIGHTGTLDPLATGLLILLIGKKFTKQQVNYLKQDKEYECTAKLGLTSDSYDIEGEILHTTAWEKLQQINQEKLELVLPTFKGEIQQTVPIFSAVKQKGKKLYQLAREAKNNPEVKKMVDELLQNLPVRTVTIKSLDLLDFHVNKNKQEITFSFRVECSSGTYIRSLAHDIGQKLGVGATVLSLRRTKIGEITLDQAQMCPLIPKRKVVLGQ